MVQLKPALQYVLVIHLYLLLQEVLLLIHIPLELMEALKHTNTPSFDPVALGYVFAPGVTYSVDAIIYNKPLVAGNPDPTACTNNTSSITLITEATL